MECLPDWLSEEDEIPLWDDILFQGEIAELHLFTSILHEVTMVKDELLVRYFARI